MTSLRNKVIIAGVGESDVKQVGESTAKTAAVGAAVGAAAGAVRGRAGRGAAQGAAGGAAGGMMRGLFRTSELDPIERGYVTTCLGERGYRVIGWK